MKTAKRPYIERTTTAC